MTKYIKSKQEYSVNSAEELLEQIKNQVSYTKDLSLQEYMDNIAALAINKMTNHNVPTPASADDIVEIWKKIGLIEEVE